MKRFASRPLLLIAAILGFVAVGIACFEWRRPRFEGRTAREWVNELVRNGPNAKHALLSLGADAVPALVDAVEQKQSRGIAFLDSVRPSFPKFIARHLPRRFEAEARGQRAIEVLNELGTNAAPAVPALIRDELRRNDWWEFSPAHTALINIGEAGIPQFIRVLRSRDPRERTAAARYLGAIGPSASQSTTDLVRLIQDPDRVVRWEAVAALSQIGPRASAAIPGLKASLTTTNIDLRLQIADALWRIDRYSPTITPVLLEVLSDRGSPHRPRAAALLGQMGVAATAAVPALKSVTNEVFSYTRVKAEEALTLIEQSAATRSSGRQ